MKKTICTLLFGCLIISLWAQTPTKAPDEKSDTALAALIINRYLSYVDFTPTLKDSVLSVVTYVVDREHTEDTMTIYHWYAKDRQLRIEMWQNGELQEGFYSDGKEFFRMFRPNVRDWVIVSQDNFYDYTIPHDIRGALYDWRSKGAEAHYAGQYNYNGQDVDRVFVTCPEVFDRYYFFETKTGLLFMVTEQDHLYGDAKKGKNARKVDWRAWHEFTPFNGFLLPSIESYQVNQNQIVFIYRHYRTVPYDPTLFNQDYHKK